MIFSKAGGKREKGKARQSHMLEWASVPSVTSTCMCLCVLMGFNWGCLQQHQQLTSGYIAEKKSLTPLQFQ